MKVDFPAFGLPRIATFFPSGNSIDVSGTKFSRCDFKIFKFLECSALILICSKIPFFIRSSYMKESDFLSILLITVIKSLFNFLSLYMMSRSSLFKFSVPSNKRIISDDSSTAIQA